MKSVSDAIISMLSLWTQRMVFHTMSASNISHIVEHLTTAGWVSIRFVTNAVSPSPEDHQLLPDNERRISMRRSDQQHTTRTRQVRSLYKSRWLQTERSHREACVERIFGSILHAVLDERKVMAGHLQLLSQWTFHRDVTYTSPICTFYHSYVSDLDMQTISNFEREDQHATMRETVNELRLNLREIIIDNRVSHVKRWAGVPLSMWMYALVHVASGCRNKWSAFSTETILASDRSHQRDKTFSVLELP